MPESFRVRDPVHNFIELRDDEAKLIATPLFQRLRGVRQLALANLVYPGALHTRFDHTLGVCHVAGLMANHLRLNDDEVRLVRYAALLHDLGHGPFSHVSEYVLNRYADREQLPPNLKKEKIHELVTAQLAQSDTSLAEFLSSDMRSQVVKLLSGGYGRPVLRSIVSGPLDADKQDYLLRDSRFCGVQYGVFDLHQLHRSLVLDGASDEEDVMVREDGVHALEQFVLAKYYLTTNVYRHRVRLITDQMIVRALVLGIDADEIPELADVYRFQNTPEFAQRLAEWDDARIIQTFGADESTLCGQLLKRLRLRHLHKRVFRERIQAFPDPAVCEKILELGRRANDDIRLRVESGIAEILSCEFNTEVEPGFVIAHSFDVKSVRTSSRNDESGILITDGGSPQPFEEYSTLFASIDEQYSEASIEVYAPVTWDTRAERKQRRRSVRQPIRDLIESEVRAANQGGAA